MRRLFILAMVMLACLSVNGQLFNVTNFTGTTFYGSYGVTVTSAGSFTTYTDPCLLAPTTYWIGASGPGSYTYTFSKPVYTIYMDGEGLNTGEYVQIYLNGSPYTITPADVLSYNVCPGGTALSFLSGGLFYGPTTDYNGGEIEISLCTGITSCEMYCNGILAGIAYHFEIDTVRPPSCAHAISNQPCLNDTLFLDMQGDSTGATYHWTGPGGFTSTLQDPFIYPATFADTGVYTCIMTLGGANDTSSTDAVILPLPTVTATSNAAICSGNTLLLAATADSADERYKWTGPNGFTSTLENPNISGASVSYSGLYKVVTKFSTGCKDSNTIFVVIDSTPALPSVSNNTPLCSQTGILQLNSSDATPGVSYGWSGPLGFASGLQNITIPDASTSLSGVYTATAYVTYSDLMCVNANSTTVTIDSTPLIPTLGSNSPVCSGTSLNFTATGSTGSIYDWSGPIGFTSDVQNPTIGSVITAATGTYSVTATIVYSVPSTISCTSGVATIFAVVDSTPATPGASSNSPASNPICQGDTLFITSNDATAGVNYTWAGPEGFSSTNENITLANIMPAATGQYTVTVQGNSFCVSSTVITVSITPTPALSVTSNSPVCTGIGDTLFLKAISDPTTTFNWTGPYVFRSTAQNPFRDAVIPEYGGIYKVTAFLNGCASAEVNDTVVVNQTPPMPWVKWLNYCLNYPAPALQASGDSILWYASSAPNGLGSITAPIPSTAALGNTFYYASQTLNGCTSAIDSIQVSVFPLPSLTVSRDTQLCPNDSIVLTALDPDKIAYYHWAPAIYLSDTTTPSVTVHPETDVTYNVVATNEYGCMDTAKVTVNVLPAATISLGDSITLYPGQSYNIVPATNCSYFIWYPASGLNSPYLSNPTATPQISTKYVVYATTSWGCIASDSINIYVSDQSVFAVPNAFVPGTGPNNLFKVIVEGEATLSNFTIYDRWGIKVFETTDINQGWDGTYNGQPQPQGVYIYQVNAVSSAGQTCSKTGNVTLLR